MYKTNDFKSPDLYYPTALVHDQEPPSRAQRKNPDGDIRRHRPTTPVGRTKTIEINATEDINETAEAFIKRFKQQQEPPPRKPHQRKNIIVRGGDPTAMVRKTIESRASIEDIDESAEAFIKRFKQQLKIQRLESIENYQKMLARGL